MVSNLRRCIVFAVGLMLMVNLCLADTVQKVPRVSLKVIDAATRQSLPHIAVHYMVLRQTRRTSTLGVLPPIEPLVARVTVSKLTAYTDSDGMVEFPEVQVPLMSHLFSVDEIESQKFFINLEPSPDAERFLSDRDEKADRYTLLLRSQPKLERVTTPDHSHKGFLLTIVNGLPGAHGREEAEATVEFRPEQLDRNVATTLQVALKSKI